MSKNQTNITPKPTLVAPVKDVRSGERPSFQAPPPPVKK
jgi:hypothetical protein